MIGDPDRADGEEIVFDFGAEGSGFQFWGDYWYVKDFTVTNTADGQKGIQVAGSNNVFEQIYLYKNGNTGLQISGVSTEPFSMWPANNLILNCTSFNNKDAAEEDADGFAAKLTCGEGNIFYGCISAYNADDGWDCFAKTATGSIGSVTLINCVAYRNGYIIEDDGTVRESGNGNGFKLGGSALSGYHRLINSIAYDNKAKGIDSNSCPDIQVENCTSYNNGSYNVALYSNSGIKTDFSAKGVISYRVDYKEDVLEQIKLNQKDGSTTLESANNYFWKGTESVNKDNAKITSDMFVSLDTSIAPTRNADGTINMHGVLQLTSAAPSDAGARFENYTLDYIRNLMNAAYNPNLVDSNDTITDSTVSDTIPETALTDAVKQATGCTTVSALKTYLADAIVNSTGAKEKLSGVPSDNTKVVDVVVKISFNGGKSWVVATPENFPKAGVDVYIPYPANTNGSGYDFVIGHLITADCNGLKAGTIEYFSPEKTDNGLKIHIMSASPFVIGWKEVEDSDDDDEPTVLNLANKSLVGKKGPKTFDYSDYVPVVPMPELAVTENIAAGTVATNVAITTDATGFAYKAAVAAAAAVASLAVLAYTVIRRKKKEQ
jgi:hypothetical protein